MTDQRLRLGFVCVRNAGRSQMAAAFARRERDRRGLDEVEILTGGTHPAEAVHEVVVEAMREVGIDLSREVPRRMTDVELASCAVVATMGCSTLEVDADTELRDWALGDPDERPIEEVREIRDEVERWVRDLFDELTGEMPDATAGDGSSA